MEIISIPQLRLGQLQTLADKSLEITQPIALVAEAHAAAKGAYDRFLIGMQKEAAASDKKTLDKTRDAQVSGFMFGIKAETYFPHSEETVKTALKKLMQLTGDYGFKINKLPYDEETAAIDNLLAEAKAVDYTGLEHLSRWLPEIEKANAGFKEASNDYLESLLESSATDAASAAAPDLITALEDLYTLIFAHARVTGTEELTSTYQKLSTLVDTFR